MREEAAWKFDSGKYRREESRHFEFFSGYDDSGTSISKNNRKGYPNYFEHFRPFPRT